MADEPQLQEMKIIAIVINSWIRSLNVSSFPDTVKHLVMQLYDKWNFNATSLRKLEGNDSFKDVYYCDEWLFNESNCDQELCIEMEITKLPRPGDISIGVMQKNLHQFVLEGLYGSIISTLDDKRNYNYAKGKDGGITFITDMDDVKIDNQTKVDIIIKYDDKLRVCCVGYMIDGKDYGDAWTKIEAPIALIVIMNKEQTEISGCVKYHKYLIASK